MKRDDDSDTFSPEPFQRRSEVDGDRGASGDGGEDALDVEVERVIRTLEPLTTDERRARLTSVLAGRIDSVTVVLDNPHDPHNASAVLRSCDAFGIQTLHVLREQEEFLASRAVALGSQRWVDIVEHRRPETLVADLRKGGYTILVTHPEGRLLPEDLRAIPKAALVLGNERDGVGHALTIAADDTIRVPMRGFVESLNMSVTAALLMHAATWLREGDLPPPRARAIYARWLTRSVPRAEEILAIGGSEKAR